MTALAVITYIALAYFLLLLIKRMHVESRHQREQSSWLAHHQRDVRAKQTQREADESRPITWRRGR